MYPPHVGETLVEVLVTVFGAALLSESLKLITELRSSGLHCELYYGTDPLGTQIRYALKKGIPFVVIVGPDELASAQVTVRDLRLKSQTQVARSDVANWLRERVARQ